LNTQAHDEIITEADPPSSSPGHSLAIAKITRPRVSGIIIRNRLFEAIDMAGGKPVIWIAAPAGSGKTTLAASYLGERKMRSLWYQVDEGDANIAGFFYFMGLAAKKASPHKKDHLPLLTPEYLRSITAFTKRYFEKLFDWLEVPSVVVFDNYQDVPESSEFHTMMAYCLGMIPEGIQVIILSRAEPPKECIRLFANDLMHRMYWSDLRFSTEEFENIIKLKGLSFSVNGTSMRQFYDKTEGWAAGIVLLIESIKREGIDYHRLDELAEREIFDYFAGELFESSDKEVRNFLLKSSFLPKMTVHSAEKLTGLKTSGRILSNLSRNNYFTDRHFSRESEYQYHPLFRNFLLSRAGDAFSGEEIHLIKEKAASILEETGHVEDAAKLYIEVRGWESLTKLILNHAPNLLAQGRGKTLEEWMEGIPDERKKNTPWLLYWSGLCLQSRDPLGSCILYEQAFDIFERSGDIEGTYRAWARFTEAVVHAWTDFTCLDRWIAWLDGKMKAGPSFPSRETEVDVAISMTYALTHRKLDHPAIAMWVEKALSLTLHGFDNGLRIKTLIYASQYYTLMGDAAHTIIVCEELKRMMKGQVSAPVLTIQHAFMEAALQAWARNDADASLRAVEEGLACAEKNDIHLWDHILCLLGVHAAMFDGIMPLACEYLERFAHSLEILGMDSCHYHYCAAWYHFLAGDVNRAGVHARRAIDLAVSNGVFFTEVCAHHDMAQVLGRTGKFLEARAHLDRLGEMAEKSKSAYFLFTWLIAEAQSAMEQGDDTRCTAYLKRAMMTGREHCLYSLYYWWDPRVMSRLCVKALEKGIEQEYVKQLIRIRHLQPQEDARLCEIWPWPVVIKTFGGFSQYKDDHLVKFSGKIQHKPLVMLKAIVAAGEKGITEDRLIDAIWPDTEGDKALQSFKFTLHQLRKLTGNETILFRGGVVIVDPGSCWTDVRAFSEQISIAESLPQSGSDTSKAICAAEKALSLYKGEFLAGDEKLAWAVPLRERFKNRFLSLVSRLGTHYEKSLQWENALKCYRKAIDIYDSVAELHQAIIRCTDRLG